eukprot:scaffold138575_cov148-Phaeocystis_antarctica.AAC.2
MALSGMPDEVLNMIVRCASVILSVILRDTFIGAANLIFLALHPNREQSLSEADRRVVPVAKIVPGAACLDYLRHADRLGKVDQIGDGLRQTCCRDRQTSYPKANTD